MIQAFDNPQCRSFPTEHYLDMVGDTSELSTPYAGGEPDNIRALSSAVEHLVDIEGVRGSIPLAPTKQKPAEAGQINKLAGII